MILINAVPSYQLAERSLSMPLIKYPNAKRNQAVLNIREGMYQLPCLTESDSPVGIMAQASNNHPV